ncbi:phosphonopyruvate decarboxylase [Acuticoccus sp.]|uniref:phosphonopyruvate decarboxylase n=1 Tax=Acuticoccus sp. TaxID=1904378 RepID=UPI003B523764
MSDAPMTVDWPADIFAALKAHGVRQVPFVPDAGHARLIEMVHAEPTMRGITLTTEEEGVALCAGAWLGGAPSVLLMQSSGVGNTINMLSLIRNGRYPFMTIVTMRGEYGEFNGWQVPMGSTTPEALRLAGLEVIRVDARAEAGAAVDAAAKMAFGGGAGVAVLLSQKLIGAKTF